MGTGGVTQQWAFGKPEEGVRRTMRCFIRDVALTIATYYR